MKTIETNNIKHMGFNKVLHAWIEHF